MTGDPQQDQTERRAERAGRNEPVGSESRLHRGQREGADNGADADRSQQNAVELGAARDLIACDQREQRPVSACEEEERYRSYERRAQIRIVSRMPETDHQGAGQTLRRKPAPLRRRRAPPEQGPDYSGVAPRVYPEPRRDAPNAADHAAQRTSHSPARADADAAARHFRSHIL